MHRLFIALLLLWGGFKTMAANRDIRLAFRGSRYGGQVSVGGNLKPINTGAKLHLGRAADRAQAGRPQQNPGPWSGNFEGFTNKGHFWSKIVKGGNSPLGGLDPVPGEDGEKYDGLEEIRQQ